MDYYLFLPGAPSRSPLLLAAELGLELNLIHVDLLKEEQMKPEFLAVSVVEGTAHVKSSTLNNFISTVFSVEPAAPCANA
jgi:hypothetical protein